MSPKFKYKQTAKITCGFYAGHTCTILFPKRKWLFSFVYVVEIVDAEEKQNPALPQFLLDKMRRKDVIKESDLIAVESTPGEVKTLRPVAES